MGNPWVLAGACALIASLIAIWFKISAALSEIVVGTVAQLVISSASFFRLFSTSTNM